MRRPLAACVVLVAALTSAQAQESKYYQLPKDDYPHDVAVGADGRLWYSGNVSVYDPSARIWNQWLLPGKRPRTYAVWVDADDKVWLSDWGTNAIVRFDPVTERFESFPSDRPGSNVRQILGRKGEAWIAEFGTERIRVIRYAPTN